MKKLVILMALLFAWPAGAQTTHPVASCSESAFAGAVSAAVDGDTVLGPSGGGSATWSSTLTVAKGIYINGNGCAISQSGTTQLVDLTADNVGAPNGPVLTWTGFTMSGEGNCGNNSILAHGDSGNNWVRITGNTFNLSTNLPILCVYTLGSSGTSGDGTHVLIDHNTFSCPSGCGGGEYVHILGNSSSTGWSTDVVPGSANMVFIENNTFTYTLGSGSTGGASAIQTYWGSRVVTRNNTFTNLQIDHHGLSGSCPPSGARWSRWWEDYNNVFNVTSVNQPNYFDVRGGSGVNFGNTVTGTNTGAGGLTLTDDCSGTYPDRDQIGRGLNQALSPAYLWSVSSAMSVVSGSSNVQSGRDYFVSTGQPATLERCESAADVTAGCPVSYAYTPYTYPHPLTRSTAGTPTFSPVAGTYTGTQTVTITSSPSTVICWNTSGSPSPATNGAAACNVGFLYSGPVTVSASETLYAVGGGTGFTDSSVGSAAYVISAPLSVSAGLQGTGINPVVTLLPSSNTFATTRVGNSSSDSPVTFALNNQTSSSLTSLSIGFATGINFNDTTPTTTCGTSLAAGAQCLIYVTFAPTAPGTLTDTLNVTWTGSSASASLLGMGSVLGAPKGLGVTSFSELLKSPELLGGK